MKRWVTVLLTLCMLASAARSPVGARPSLGTATNRLAALARLWGDIKYFDPQLAYRDVDWDAALLDAIPKVEAATTMAAYSAAVQSMLDALQDPATHVIGPTSTWKPNVATAFVTLKPLDKGKAVVTFDTGATQSSGDALNEAEMLSTSIAKYQAVLFDLRTSSRPSDDQARLIEAALEGRLGAAVIFGDLRLPAMRTRTYDGFPNQAEGIQAADYFAGFRVLDGAVVTGTAKARPSVAFLVNANSAVPDVALAMERDGAATILADGAQPRLASGESATLDMGEGVRASFRLSEYADIGPDDSFATLMPHPDVSPTAALTWLGVHPSVPIPFVAAPAGRHLFDSPYAAPAFPDEAHRLLAVFRIYNIVRYFWPYKALMDDDWNADTAQAIDEVRSDRDARAYVLSIYRYYAHLHDSHGYISGSLPERYFAGGAPWTTRWLHGQAVVTRLNDPRAAAAGGVRVGDTVSAIDGVPIDRAIARRLPYVDASTKQAAYRDVLSNFAPGIFSGESANPIRITFHHPGTARAFTSTFARSAAYTRHPRTGPIVRILPGNIGYVDLDRLQPSEVDAMFAKVASTRALVFDDRGYPLGTAWQIAPRLTTRTEVRGARFDRPQIDAPTDTTGAQLSYLQAFQPFYQMLPEAQGSRYLKPIVMLIDENTQSQAEHAGLLFEAATPVRYVGSATAGANGDVTMFTVPGGIRLGFTGQSVRHADGRQLQRVGLLPNVAVTPTARAISVGNDVVLQAGLSEALRLARVAVVARTHSVALEAAQERAAFDAAKAAMRTMLATEAIDARLVGKSLPQAVATSVLSGTWSRDQPNSTGYHRSDAPTGGWNGGPQVALAAIGPQTGFGTNTKLIDPGPYRGKTVHIFGMLRSAGAGGGGFWARVDGPQGVESFDNMQGHWLAGTRDWTPFSVVVRVPQDAAKIYAGLLLEGSGSIYGSNVQIEIVPDTTPLTGT